MSKSLATSIALLAALSLTSCGGNGDPNMPVEPLTPVSPVITAQSRVFIPGDAYYMTVVSGSRIQTTTDGRVMEVFPYRDISAPTVANYLTYGQQDGATWQYIYDEMFWAPPNITIGANEAAINSVAAQMRAAGFKPAVTILPGVIMSAGFALASPNSYDSIAIDLYPSNFLAENPGLQATYSDALPNKYISLLTDCVAKLRAVGFTGDIWYIYQDENANSASFGPTAWTPTMKQLQYDAIKWAPYNGIVGLVSYNV